MVAAVAQLVESMAVNHVVRGSNPRGGASNGPKAKVRLSRGLLIPRVRVQIPLGPLAQSVKMLCVVLTQSSGDDYLSRMKKQLSVLWGSRPILSAFGADDPDSNSGRTIRFRRVASQSFRPFEPKTWERSPPEAFR